jgi:hypothetical protein
VEGKTSPYSIVDMANGPVGGIHRADDVQIAGHY